MARIVGARLRVLRAPVSDGIAMSFSPLRHRSAVLVELSTSDGLVGRGESWINYPPWAAEERVATLRDGVLPLLMGRDASRIASLHDLLCSRLDPLGRQWGAPGPVRQAISGADLALWDLAGQRSGCAVGALAPGPVRDAVPVYASSLGPDGVGDTARACLVAGHTALKLKVGFGREVDERNLSEARAVAGPDVALYADANQAWDVDEAVAMAPLLRAADVAWIEEPVRGNALAALEELHRRTGLTIATGENMYGRHEFRVFAASPAIGILQPDLAKTGGLTEVRAICAVAEACGTPVLPHLYGGAIAFAATLQLAAAAAPVAGLEYDIRDNPLRDPLLDRAPTPDGGVLIVPDGPGWGVTVDEDAIEAVTDSEVQLSA